MCRTLLHNCCRATLGLMVGLAVCGSAQAEDFATVRITDRNKEIVIRGQSPEEPELINLEATELQTAPAIQQTQCAAEPCGTCQNGTCQNGTCQPCPDGMVCRSCPDHCNRFDPGCHKCRLLNGICGHGNGQDCPGFWALDSHGNPLWIDDCPPSHGLGNGPDCPGMFGRMKDWCINFPDWLKHHGTIPVPKGDDPGVPLLGKYRLVYPVNPGYFDARDGQVYAAQGYGGPVSVPLAPNVRHTYNYGWGVPSSRLTPISHPLPVQPVVAP